MIERSLHEIADYIDTSDITGLYIVATSPYSNHPRIYGPFFSEIDRRNHLDAFIASKKISAWHVRGHLDEEES